MPRPMRAQTIDHKKKKKWDNSKTFSSTLPPPTEQPPNLKPNNLSRTPPPAHLTPISTLSQIRFYRRQSLLQLEQICRASWALKLLVTRKKRKWDNSKTFSSALQPPNPSLPRNVCLSATALPIRHPSFQDIPLFPLRSCRQPPRATAPTTSRKRPAVRCRAAPTSPPTSPTLPPRRAAPTTSPSTSRSLPPPGTN